MCNLLQRLFAVCVGVAKKKRKKVAGQNSGLIVSKACMAVMQDISMKADSHPLFVFQVFYSSPHCF